MNRLWSFLPLVPLLAAVVAWSSPPSPSTLAYYPSMVSYSALRANIFVGSFYASAIITIVILFFHSSKLTTLIGLASCFSFLNIVYLWTADHFVTFQWLVWAAWSPTNGIGFFMLDWLTVGMVGLAGVIAFVAWFRKGATSAIFRTLEVASFAVLLLPAYILIFDYGEFYLHVANVGPTWLTNQVLLVGTVAMLAATSFVDYLVQRERRKAIGSALAAAAHAASA